MSSTPLDASTPVSSSAELPFVAAPPGSVAEVTAAAQAAARAWGLPAPALLRLSMNGIFAAGPDVVLRVSRPTAPPEQALWLARRLAGEGLRVPQPVVDVALELGELAVIAVERVETAGPVDWRAVGAMIATLHGLDVATFRGHIPVPRGASFPWWHFERLLAEVRGEIDTQALAGLRAAIDRHGGWELETEPVLCHGDVHPGNVIQALSGPVLLDWDLLCTGPPAWDHAPLMTWADCWGGEARCYQDFAAGYGRSMNDTAAGEALAELRLVAATLMRVRAGRHDPAAAQEGERRLRYWRGDADPPQWTAQ